MGDLLDVVLFKGTVFTYGGLTGKSENINPINLIYQQKKLKGFFLASWITDGGILFMVPRMYSVSGKVNAGLEGPDGWGSTQFMDTTMDKAHEDIVKLLGSSATGEKLCIWLDN